jgi:hypothetical protein
MHSIPLILTSSSSSDIYVNNTSAQFTNIFPDCISVDNSKCKIALQSIVFDANFSNVPNEVAHISNQFMILCDTYANEEKSSYLLHYFNIENQFYTVENLLLELDSKIPILPTDNSGNAPSIKLSIENGLITFDIQYCTLLICAPVCEWLGIDKSNTSVSDGEYVMYEHDTQLVCKNSSLTEALFPKLIKIQLQQISGPDKDLAILSFEKTSLNKPLYHTVIRKEYFALNTDIFEAATIALVDQNNLPLLLLRGQPTVVQLIIKEMKFPSFMIRINSEEHKEMFPDNERENFRSQIAHVTDLSYEKWEVALTSIHFPPTIDIKCALEKEEFWIEFVTIDGVATNKKIVFHDDDIYDTTSLKECINSKVKQAIGEVVFVFDFFENKAKLFFYKPMVVRFSSLFSYVIGRDITSANELNIKTARQLTFVKNIDLERCKPNVIFLHCDFISPSIVGNEYRRVLKMIPFTNRKYECKHLDFMNVMTNDLSTIHIQLMDASGNQIKFSKFDKDIVLVNLVFQQRK